MSQWQIVIKYLSLHKHEPIVATTMTYILGQLGVNRSLASTYRSLLIKAGYITRSKNKLYYFVEKKLPVGLSMTKVKEMVYYGSK